MHNLNQTENSPEYSINSIGWNNYWRSEFGIFKSERTLNYEGHYLLETEESRAAQVKYFVTGKTRDYRDFLRTRVSASWSDPVRVVSNIMAGATGYLAARTLNGTIKIVDDVISNPRLLQGKTLSEVQRILSGTSGWKEGVMNQGRSAGKGWTMRQLNSRGNDVTDLYIQYHPGTPRHFNGHPYWKVSSGKGGVKWFKAGK